MKNSGKNYLVLFLCFVIAAFFSTQAGAEKRSPESPESFFPICAPAGSGPVPSKYCQ